MMFSLEFSKKAQLFHFHFSGNLPARKLEREPVPRILSKQMLQRIAEHKVSQGH